MFTAELAQLLSSHSGAPVVVKKEPSSNSSPAPVGTHVDGIEDGPLGPLKAYLLVFDSSIEKYTFEQELVRESAAVDTLIRARKHLTLRLDDLGRGVSEPGAIADAATSSRTGGSGRGSAHLNALLRRKVVVDMREFRSALPFMLYLRGLCVEPVTIPVGDYVLSRDISVERKAIPDLIQSLASGRLYQQAQNLSRHYSNPSLLIEFDPAKSFALQNTYTVARREVDVSTRDLLGKLALMVLHFPQLRIIWSPSQRFTADTFLKLKAGRHEPDSKAAAQIEDEIEADQTAENGDAPQQRRAPRSNTAAFEVLRKLPGVAPGNMFALARRGGSLAGVASLTLEELTEVLGPVNARQLHEFLHAAAAIPPEPETAAEAEAAAEIAQAEPQVPPAHAQPAPELASEPPAVELAEVEPVAVEPVVAMAMSTAAIDLE